MLETQTWSHCVGNSNFKNFQQAMCEKFVSGMQNSGGWHLRIVHEGKTHEACTEPNRFLLHAPGLFRGRYVAEQDCPNLITLNSSFCVCLSGRTVHSVTSDTPLGLDLSRSTSGFTSEMGANSPQSCDDSMLTLSPDSNQVCTRNVQVGSCIDLLEHA